MKRIGIDALAVVDSLEIKQIAAIQRFVHSLSEERRFLRDVLSFEEIAVSGPEIERETRQRSAVFRAGSCVVVSSEPLEIDSVAGRYLQLHPEGIGAILLDVENVERALRVIEGRGGTPVGGIERDRSVAAFAVATPLNDVSLVFVERRQHPA
ncbi:MAG TPA: VOC family protein, partial [Polyangiaceae bacterium]|nr:VOC family protein [Polyangiaceae bacterium]